jgi:hypothetical protein
MMPGSNKSDLKVVTQMNSFCLKVLASTRSGNVDPADNTTPKALWGRSDLHLMHEVRIS